jgi:hypothetical protein
MLNWILALIKVRLGKVIEHFNSILKRIFFWWVLLDVIWNFFEVEWVDLTRFSMEFFTFQIVKLAKAILNGSKNFNYLCIYISTIETVSKFEYFSHYSWARLWMEWKKNYEFLIYINCIQALGFETLLWDRCRGLQNGRSWD